MKLLTLTMMMFDDSDDEGNNDYNYGDDDDDDADDVMEGELEGNHIRGQVVDEIRSLFLHLLLLDKP